MWNYTNGEAHLTDALRLSQGMSYKNAMAGLELGGGKAVIWGDSRKDKSIELFKAFGRAIESLQGKYYTAEDVGIDVRDIDVAATETKYAAGTSGSGKAASGDPSPVTALGVYRGIVECAKRVYGSGNLNGKRIAVQGVGSVGGYLSRYLAQAGADLFIADISERDLKKVKSATGATIVDPDDIYDVDVDIFSPNALGAIVNEKTLARFKAKIIAGGANNQLITDDMGDKLREQGILYAPDYVINGGGIINVAAEISGNYSRDWVDGKLEALTTTLGDVLDRALETDTPTNAIADQMAVERIGRG